MNRFFKSIKLIFLLLVVVGLFGFLAPLLKGLTNSNNGNGDSTELEISTILVQSNVKVLTHYYENIGDDNPIVTEIGSGVIISNQSGAYRIITNFHAISEGQYALAEYEIKTYEESIHEATYIAGNSEMDLAVLEFSSLNQYRVEVISNSTLHLGIQVLAIGSPNGNQNTVSQGIIESLTNLPNYDYQVIRHTAALSQGSSGGALYTIGGQFIGLNTWMTDSGFYAIRNQQILTFLNSIE